MELIERPCMRAVNYLNSISYAEFRNDCVKDATDNGGKKPTEKDMKTWFSLLQQFCKTNMKTKGVTTRVYSYSLSTKNAELGGRLFCGGSMQGIWNVYRGLLMRETGTDIDMANAHPVILRYICKIHGINCAELEYYIKNRGECLDAFKTKNISRSQAKIMYLMATNNDKIIRNGTIKTDHFKKYEKEMKEIQKRLIEIDEYKALFETIEDYKKQKNYNGCAINKILCFYENKILQHAIHVINQRGIEMAILMFDGVMVYGDFYDDDELLKSITEYVDGMMPDLNMKWAYKDHDDSLHIPDDFDENSYKKDKNYRYVDDDNSAAIMIFEEIKDSLIPAKNGRLFMKDKNVWICDNAKIENYLLNYILNSNICRANEDKKYIPFVQNVKSAKNVKEALLVKIRSQEDVVDIYEKFHSTTKGRLCFKDGVLDMKMKKFYKWDNIDFEYYTVTVINYEFNDYFNNPNKELITQVKNEIFKNLFGGDITKALQFISRAVSGHTEDKNWATYLGNRDCGKGILFTGLKTAFGDYVNAFELGNILISKFSHSDEGSRKMYWLLDYEFVRLAISQETPESSDNKKLSGAIVKKVMGGDDEQIARRNYETHDTHFKTDITLFLLGNNDLKVDVKDTDEHRIRFSSVNQYKTQAEIDKMKENGEDELIWGNYKVKDPKISDRCKTVDYGMAIAYLIYENYTSEAIKIEIDEDDEGDISLRREIVSKYIITRNSADVVLASDVFDELKTDNKKVINELASMGVLKKKYKGGGKCRDKVCFIGLKQPEVSDIELEEI